MPGWVSGSLFDVAVRGAKKCRCRLAKRNKTAKPISVGSTKGYLKTPAQNENAAPAALPKFQVASASPSRPAAHHCSPRRNTHSFSEEAAAQKA